MFKVDMAAIRKAAMEAQLTPNVDSPASPVRSLANLATLAISHIRSTDLDPVLADLLISAMYTCNAWNDSDAAREEMRLEVLNTPNHLRADLLDHLNQVYRNLPY
jgi:hypothetical protein